MKKKINFRDILIFILACALAALSVQYILLATQNKRNSESNIEVERKFLLDLNNLPPDMAERAEIFEFVQTYINYSPEIRVREVNETYYYFTIKLPKDNIGLSREEIEFLVTEEEYRELLTKQVGMTIYKTRYQFYEEGFLITVDIYSHELSGLAVAEVEFANVKQSESYRPPHWFGPEITSDKRYKNANLARDGMP
ncbi:MAG: CYTH domain-containing protein [Clostridiales bacterium]|nr:CYTH domain-containing protein [Clostridiales bacterium]